MKYSWAKTFGKAARDVGIVVGSVGAVAALTAISQPEVVAPLVAASGPVASFVALGIAFGARAGLDWFKHRNDKEEDK